MSTKPSLRRQDPELRVHEKEMSLFRPAASHSVRLCTCPPDCRTNEQTAWLAKAVRAMSARPLRVWHLPSKRSPEMPAVPRLVCGLSAQLLFCLPVGSRCFALEPQAVVCLRPLRQLLPRPGLKGDTRRGCKAFQAGAQSASGRCTGYRCRG